MGAGKVSPSFYSYYCVCMLLDLRLLQRFSQVLCCPNALSLSCALSRSRQRAVPAHRLAPVVYRVLGSYADCTHCPRGRASQALALPASPACRQSSPFVLLWASNTTFQRAAVGSAHGLWLVLEVEHGCGLVASGGSWTPWVTSMSSGSPFQTVGAPGNICISGVLTYCPCSLVSRSVTFIKDVGPNCDLLC